MGHPNIQYPNIGFADFSLEKGLMVCFADGDVFAKLEAESVTITLLNNRWHLRGTRSCLEGCPSCLSCFC